MTTARDDGIVSFSGNVRAERSRNRIDMRTKDPIRDAFDRVEKNASAQSAQTRALIDFHHIELQRRIARFGEEMGALLERIREDQTAIHADLIELKAGQARLERGLTRLDLRMLALERDRAG